MLISLFGYVFLFVGLLILGLPLLLVELSRPRDWLIGGLFLFIGFFLLVENDLLRGSINFLVVSISILFGQLISEIIQNRWNQLGFEEKKRIGTFERWFESFKQLSQIIKLLCNSFFNFFKRFGTKSEKSLKEKKWVHPELKEEIKNKVVVKSDSTSSNQVRNQDLTENEETS